jgi:hypothetical protein
MPKLHGLRQRSYFNTWDAFNLREFRERRAELKARGIEDDGTDLPIYGNKNVGTPHLTNLASAGGVGGMPDATKFIRNWYARTNIGLGLSTDAAMTAWLAWTHATTVTMIMGCMPVAQLSLSDLLRRQNDSSPIDGIRMSGAHEWAPDSYTMPDGWNDRQWEASGLHDPDHHEKWLAAARAVAELMDTAGPIVLPIRQDFRVDIETEPRSLSALLEVIPTNIAPQVLVWVHVEGVAQIDAA